MGWVALAVAAVGLVTGAGASAMEGDAQHHEIEAQRRMYDYQAQQKTLDTVRQARIARAQALQNASNQGALSSSSAITGASGIVNQAESQENQISAEQSIGHSIFAAKNDLIDDEGWEKLGSSLFHTGMSAYSMGGSGGGSSGGK